MNRVPDRIHVLYGGVSRERDVSLKSGAAVINGLAEAGFHPVPVDITSANWKPEGNIQFAFLALHGEFGEDGQIQGILESAGIPFTGSNARASKLAFDKNEAKAVISRAGIAVPEGVVLTGEHRNLPDSFIPPLVIKPVRDGSSLGLGFVHCDDQWESSFENCLKHTDEVLVEKCIAGRELTVGILGGSTLPVIEIISGDGGYNYQKKYSSGGARHICPAQLTDSLAARVSTTALTAFNALGCSSVGRVDIILDHQNTPVVLEVNTLPGMTEFSLLPEAAQAAGISFASLCRKLIHLSLSPALTQS